MVKQLVNLFSKESRSDQQQKLEVRKGFRFSVVAVLLCAIAVISLGIDYLLNPKRFPIKHINIQGDLLHTQPVQISRAISEVASTNILRINVAKAAQVAEALPWIDDVVVKRRWPDTLDVYVNERVIQARWNDDEWLDQIGKPVKLLYHSDKTLPVLRGPKGSEQEVLAKFRVWQTNLEVVDLKIVEIKKSETDSWSVRLWSTAIPVIPAESETEDSAEVFVPNYFWLRLGNYDPQFQLLRFTHLYKELFEKYNQSIASIDMRYPDGVTVQWLDQEAPLIGHGKFKIEQGV